MRSRLQIGGACKIPRKKNYISQKIEDRELLNLGIKEKLEIVKGSVTFLVRGRSQLFYSS